MRRFATVVAMLAAGLTAARGGADLVLVDGRLLQGTAIERKDGAYLLTTTFGNVVTVPLELVKEMRLTGGDATPPTGLVFSTPRTLAGTTVEPPGRREQLAAFGRPPALFPVVSISGTWYPRNAYEGRDVTHFNPATWVKATIDPVWSPVQSFTSSSDATEFHPVRWYHPSIDPVWKPRDAFAPGEWLFPIVRNRE